MQKRSTKYFILASVLFLCFALFTVIVATVDAQPIGPQQSTVGLATVNQAVFSFFGVNRLWYDATDSLGIAAIATALGFAICGLAQLIRRKSIKKVDPRILLLGAFYVAVLAFYVFFELCVVNYRPVLLSQALEASYPSSHTMVVVCLMGAAMLQFQHVLRNRKGWLLAAETVSALVIVITVVGRLLSGVHWFTDIAAGVLLSVALLALYRAALQYIEERADTLTDPQK